MTARNQRRILVTGGGGQLGGELAKCSVADFEIVALDRNECDIEDAAQVADVVKRYQPVAVINAAAYTAVDKAESEPERAFRGNAEGVENVAEAAVAVGARVVHVSTDYVFDGSAREPYPPSAPTHPLSVYGKSKLEGERAFMASGANGAIVRSAWLYASRGKNFLNTILDRIQAGKDLRVVCDQIGTPTSCADLAAVLLRVALDPEVSGIVHWTNAGRASWYDFAKEIQNVALKLGVISRPVQITSINTSEYPLPARRPPYSVLDASELTNRYGPPRDWRTALFDVVRERAKSPTVSERGRS